MVAPVPAQISKLPPCPSAAARRRSLPHPPRTPRTTHSLFVAPARCGGPLFSSLSKSLFLQPLYFHIPPNPPGVGGLRPSLLFAPLCTLFRVVALCFQSVAASFRKTPGWGCLPTFTRAPSVSRVGSRNESGVGYLANSLVYREFRGPLPVILSATPVPRAYCATHLSPPPLPGRTESLFRALPVSQFARWKQQ